MTTLRSSPTQLSPLKVPTIVITSPPASSIFSLSSSSSFPPFTLTDKSYPPSVSGAPNPSHYLLPTSFSFGKRGIISSSSSTTPTGFPSHRRFSSRTSTAATAAHRLLIVMLGSLIVLLALSSFLDGFAFAAAGAQRTLLSISIPSVDHELAAEQPPLLLLKRFEIHHPLYHSSDPLPVDTLPLVTVRDDNQDASAFVPPEELTKASSAFSRKAKRELTAKSS